MVESAPESVDLPLRGGDLVSCGVFLPFALKLQFTTGWLTVGGRFTLRSSTKSRTFDPEAERAQLGAAIAELVSGSSPIPNVTSAVAGRDGSLVVAFDSGHAIEVAPDRYEPWQAGSGEGVGSSEWWQAVSIAGGGLATWGLVPPHGSAQA